MRRRFSLGRALASAVLLSLPAVACTDEPPTASGEDLFPNGTLPATFQVVLPADSFASQASTFSGYTSQRNVGYLLVADRFEGGLSAHTLLDPGDLPLTVTYTRNNASRTDSIAGFARGALIMRVDTAASTSAGAMELRVWEAGQPWDLETVSWQLAVDTAGGRVPWTEPGGSRGPLLGSLSIPAGVRPQGDSLVVPLDSLAMLRIARSDFPGLLLTGSGGNGRVQFRQILLRPFAHPAGATPDTVVTAADVQPPEYIFIYDPDQPAGRGVWEAGGIRSARTLFQLRLPDTLLACASATGACDRVPIGRVTLNEVSLLLTPAAVPGGFRPVGPVPITLRRVAEPELGRRAPLGQVVNEVLGFDASRRVVFAGAQFFPGDSVMAVPITTFASTLAAGDTTRTSLALLSDPGALFGAPEAISFGPAWFSAAPRLRIVFTLPVRPTLP